MSDPRELLAKATPRPWRWDEPGQNEPGEPWSLADQRIDYRLLRGGNRYVLEHAQTWQIRPQEADLIVAAVNEYEALLDIADAVRRCIFYDLPEHEPPEGDGWQQAWTDAGEALARLDALRSQAW